jgi:hypothetical protein
MDIPEEWKKMIPAKDMTVSMLLKFQLPCQGSMACAPSTPASTLFSRQQPGEYEETLAQSKDIPSASYLTVLERLVRGVQKEGYHSIKGGFPGTAQGLRYPLWVVRYWSQMSYPIASKGGWTRSIIWLEGSGDKPRVEELISQLPWISPTTGRLGFSINDLFVLLSDEWLNDNHIDFFADLFGKKAAESTSKILITTLAFSRGMGGREQVSIWITQT